MVDPAQITLAKSLCEDKVNCTFSNLRSIFDPRGGCNNIPEIEMEFKLVYHCNGGPDVKNNKSSKSSCIIA